jgi:SAM-dependent methyltransferase
MCPRTLGFFYREKMRAIHRIAPSSLPAPNLVSRRVPPVLEIGGGRSGLTAMLYPEAAVVNVDVDPAFSDAPCNRLPQVQFIVADAIALPFADESFALVTMFDLLEHVPDDRRALREACRVLQPGGSLLISTPRENWVYPHYRILQPICPSEQELFEEWGHVRRGYAKADLERLIPMCNTGWSSFISPTTAMCHDLAFSRLPKVARVALCAAVSPLTWIGYWSHRPHDEGAETASAWLKAEVP